MAHFSARNKAHSFAETFVPQILVDVSEAAFNALQEIVFRTSTLVSNLHAATKLLLVTMAHAKAIFPNANHFRLVLRCLVVAQVIYMIPIEAKRIHFIYSQMVHVAKIVLALM